MALRAYAEDHGISGDEFWLFRRFVTILDAEWLKQSAEKIKNRPKGDT